MMWIHYWERFQELTVSKLPPVDTSDTFSYLVLKTRPLYFRCKFYTDFLLCRFDILKGQVNSHYVTGLLLKN